MTKILTKEELAEKLSVHPRTVKRWIKAGTIPLMHLPGRSIRFSEAEIDKWLKERTIKAKAIGRV